MTTAATDSFGYTYPEDWAVDVATDLCITPVHLRGMCCRWCARLTNQAGTPRTPAIILWDGGNGGPAGGLHCASCRMIRVAQTAHCAHNAAQRVLVELLSSAFGRINVVTSYYGNRGGGGDAMAAHSPHHTPDIMVRDHFGFNKHLLVEVRTIATEAAVYHDCTTSLGPHLLKHEETVATYRRCQGLNGRLCAFVIDARGGLGVGATYDEIHVDGRIEDRVKIMGARELLDICAVALAMRPGAQHEADIERGCPRDFRPYWRQKFAFAARKALCNLLRSAGTEPPAGHRGETQPSDQQRTPQQGRTHPSEAARRLQQATGGGPGPPRTPTRPHPRVMRSQTAGFRGATPSPATGEAASTEDAATAAAAAAAVTAAAAAANAIADTIDAQLSVLRDTAAGADDAAAEGNAEAAPPEAEADTLDATAATTAAGPGMGTGPPSTTRRHSRRESRSQAARDAWGAQGDNAPTEAGPLSPPLGRGGASSRPSA
jgi:hypothetical protein